MRDIISHHYFDIDANDIYFVCDTKLEELLETIVLMKNDLDKLVQTHQTAKKMNRIIWQNLIFSLAVVLFLVVVSLTDRSDITLSVIIHEGSTLVVILNGLRLLFN